ncbi:GNAT family N-acetyltransferase [Paraliomyxa miuraensis]|uniref:GNAT family N-acetyltransferase n=1 Tax=Paraliomyxa miuraensis TaxID=376150 RepID=UPI002251D617|nr:GNAT family N-acetyltransferase [Paraliomyxa miuraensis]MCX4247964.1 GNAT family N-acetyltransferase [Paraliomyxa miuraensis]
MLFCSVELAARIEQAEARLVVDCTRTAAREREGQQTFVLPFAGGWAAYSGPGSPLAKVAGAGLQGAFVPDELEAIEQAFARVRAPVQIELSCLADPSIGRRLTERGYVLVGFENVLGRRLTPAAPDRPPIPSAQGAAQGAAQEVEISPVEGDGLAAWLDTVVTGFAHPDGQGVESHEEFPRESLEPVMGSMARTEGFRCYLARRHGEPAGGASMRMHEGVAQLCGTSTVPAHRRRGVQGALLAARLGEAASAGCDLAVVTTLPGSRSQHNVQRHGFELLYTRAILVREALTS